MAVIAYLATRHRLWKNIYFKLLNFKSNRKMWYYYNLKEKLYRMQRDLTPYFGQPTLIWIIWFVKNFEFSQCFKIRQILNLVISFWKAIVMPLRFESSFLYLRIKFKCAASVIYKHFHLIWSKVKTIWAFQNPKLVHFDQFSKTIEWNRLNCATVFRTNKITPCRKPKGTNNAAPDSLFSIYGEAVLVVPAVMKQFYLVQYKTE